MKLTLTSREQRIILIGACLAVAILWVYVTAIMQPLQREATNMQQQVRSAREQLRALELSTANEATLREQHRQLSETVETLRKALPGEAELSSVIERISDLASQSSVKIQTVFPQHPVAPQDREGAPTGAARVYKEIPIQIDALAGYHQLGTFLSLIEQGDKPMQLSALRVSASAKEMRRHEIKLLIRSYFAVKDAESSSERPVSSAHAAKPN